MALLRLITFLSAFLLFQIELVIAKLFLPNYGGSYLVWGACIVFFQAVLLTGYVFAHLVLKRLGLKSYLNLHLGLLGLPLLFFPLRDPHFIFSGVSLPLVIDIFWRLTVTIGPVFFVLSTMSMVTQSWFASSFLKGRENPYGLYAVSNAGSFAALLTYPFVFEAFLTNTQQLQIWRILYLVLVFGNLLAWRMIKIDGKPADKGSVPLISPVSLGQMMRWLCLGAAGVVMFMSVTNIITYEIAPVPLLWVIPLGIYLLAFIFNFRQKPWCPSWIGRSIGLIIGLQTLMYFLSQKHWLPVVIVIFLLCGFLFLICMYIQHQLIISRPALSQQMTLFYVMISLGGFLGGILTSWVIPLISNTLIEYLAGLLLTALTVPKTAVKLPLWQLGIYILLAVSAFFVWPYFVKSYHMWSFVLLGGAVAISFSGFAADRKYLAPVMAVIIVAAPGLESIWQDVHFILKKRNYYGIYEIFEKKGTRVLIHGTTLHGVEFVDTQDRRIPMGYYSPLSPIGTLLINDVFHAQKIAVVGLGTGTLSMYAKPSCPIVYYELDTDVTAMARRYFWYLSEAPGDVNVISGDARLSLKSAPDGTYDLLAIDAFSGDAIPTHLLNRDVLLEYRRKLRPGGGIVFHITNRYLNLAPVLARIAADSGAYAVIKDVGDEGYNMRSIWCVLTWDTDRFVKLITDENWQPLELDQNDRTRIWTDDYSTILPIINMGELAVSLKAFKPFTW